MECYWVAIWMSLLPRTATMSNMRFGVLYRILTLEATSRKQKQLTKQNKHITTQCNFNSIVIEILFGYRSCKSCVGFYRGRSFRAQTPEVWDKHRLSSARPNRNLCLHMIHICRHREWTTYVDGRLNSATSMSLQSRLVMPNTDDVTTIAPTGPICM